MPNRLSLILCVVVSVLSPVAGARADVNDNSVPETAAPQATVNDRHFKVALPSDYDDSGLCYPVLYLFHGVGDTYTKWTSTAADGGQVTPTDGLIIVMPDGGHGSSAGWHSDWVDQPDAWDWETYHTQTLVNYVEQTFRSRGAGHRGVAGVSMGGFGAMSLAARHRDLYEVAASISGFVDTRYLAPASGPLMDFAGRGSDQSPVGTGPFPPQSFGTPTSDVWGNNQNGPAWTAHNPTDQAANLAGTQVLVATGRGTPGEFDPVDRPLPNAYATENVIYQMNLSFIRALETQGVSYKEYTDEIPNAHGYNGGHTWSYFRRALDWMLPDIQAALGAPAACGNERVDVTIDVRPGDPTNHIKVGSHGVVPVAILSGPSFDATTVDASGVCFGDAEDASQRDCSSDGGASTGDVNLDGRADLLLRFRADETGIDLGDTRACLSGSTTSGTAFAGCDSIATT